MTRFGVALPESTKPNEPGLLIALDAFGARSRLPELMPIWTRLRGWTEGPTKAYWDLNPGILTEVRARGVAPAVWAESTPAQYGDLLDGDYDDALRRLAEAADGCVVRWDQEMDGNAGFAWQGVTPALYSQVFSHVAMTMRAVADIRMFWCCIRPASAVKAGYWPGADAVQIIGFDRYRWDDDGELPIEQWANPVSQCRALFPGGKVWVGETGSLVGTTSRVAHLRQTADAGADVVHHMNLKVGPPWNDDWRWTDRMDRAFAGMVG